MPTSKFGGNAKQQKKPPICKKAVPRPLPVPEQPNALNYLLEIDGFDHGGFPLYQNRTGAIIYNPLIATYYLDLYQDVGKEFGVNVFPNFSLNHIDMLINAAPHPIGGTFTAIATAQKAAAPKPFQIGFIPLEVITGSGKASITILY